MNFKKNIFAAMAGILLSSVALTGCVTEDFDIRDESHTDSGKPSLVFDLRVPSYQDVSGSNSSYNKEYDHGEEWEAYIDQSKFRVLFFDMHGNYLFEVDPQFITLYDKGEMFDADRTQYVAYRVRMPYDYLFPKDRDPQLSKAVEDAILDDGFKVAVLANWPYFVWEGDRSSDFTDDEFLDGRKISTELDFEFDPTHTKPNSKLEYLSHCIPDGVYGAENANEAFQHVVGPDKKMGVYSSWVSYLFKSQRDAEDFIRAGQEHSIGNEIEGDVKFTFGDNTGIGPNGSSGFDGANPGSYSYKPYGYKRTIDYENDYNIESVWRLWNFSAGATCQYTGLNPRFKRTQNPQVTQYWDNRNKYILLNQLEKIDWSNGSAFEIRDNVEGLQISSDNAGCKYVPVSTEGGNTTGGYLTIPSNITTAEVDYIASHSSGDATAKSYATKMRNSGVHFQAHGEGIIRISAASTTGGKIAVFSSNPNGTKTEILEILSLEGEDENERDVVNKGMYYFEPDASGDLEYVEYFIDPSSNYYHDIYVTSVDGSTDIYEIEYMPARHVYDSGRNAIMPSASDPIPMYGVQNFNPIRKYLTPDHTFNMSDKNENRFLNDELLQSYPFKFIYMLRNVAKVELRFKASVFRNNPPTHVMMRVMNRTGRCEPMDVINPTEWLWFGTEHMNLFTGTNNVIPDEANPSSFVGVDQEFKNIVKYGPLSGKGSSVEVFRNLNSWYYGFWSQGSSGPDNDIYFRTSPWNFNNKASLPATEYPYPRIFNSRIDRSDYCRFHKVPSIYINGEEYIRYVMYSPEKNIDDADSKGDLTSRPKVQHIEVRFADMNGTTSNITNYDDNDCYWIYFTDYAENNGKIRSYYRDGSDRGNGRYTYDDAEQYDPDFLKLLQPVVRNCHYVFTINSINDEHIGVNLGVCGAAGRSTSFTIN